MLRWLMSSLVPPCVFCMLFVCGPLARAESKPPPHGFEHATPNYHWSFPRDHGRHDTFQTEWWYYTGQLYKEGNVPFRDVPAFGFQLTFFRRAITADDRSSAGRNGYLAHAVVTDIERGTCSVATRRAGGELGIAGASSETLRTWAGDWSAELFGDKHVLRFSMPSSGWPVVRLLATPAGAPVLQGQQGFSKKGACEHCASMYYSSPGLKLTGALELPSLTPVHGLGWMDHEFMTNSLAEGQVGWDWMGLMLRDGRRLTLFRLRRKDGSVDFSNGSLFDGANLETLSPEDFSLAPVKMWKSDSSQALYPVEWIVKVPKHGIEVTVRARVASCELVETGGPTYWEGPVSSPDESVLGYLEMTGYADAVKL